MLFMYVDSELWAAENILKSWKDTYQISQSLRSLNRSFLFILTSKTQISEILS